MKIYFTAAVSRADSDLQQNYEKIVDTLESLGHQVIADHILNKSRKVLQAQTEKEALQIQRKMTKWKKQADLVFAEVSTPSFGVGQEITLALSANKPVVALHEKGNEPHLLRDEAGDLLIIEEYDKHSLEKRIKGAIDYASDQQDTRFNFFISPKHQNYLDWVSKERKVPRSVFLRRLIEEDMDINEEYSG